MPRTILVDDREKKPFPFEEPTIKKRLNVGDISLEGLEDQLSIERKATIDAVQSVISGHDRFEREMIRGKELKYFAIVIEGRPEDLIKVALKQAKFYNVTPKVMAGRVKTIINTYYLWTIKHGVHVFFCTNRPEAMEVTLKLLRGYENYLERGYL
jgi:ERCC4-type nuclease